MQANATSAALVLVRFDSTPTPITGNALVPKKNFKRLQTLQGKPRFNRADQLGQSALLRDFSHRRLGDC